MNSAAFSEELRDYPQGTDSNGENRYVWGHFTEQAQERLRYAIGSEDITKDRVKEILTQEFEAMKLNQGPSTVDPAQAVLSLRVNTQAIDSAFKRKDIIGGGLMNLEDKKLSPTEAMALFMSLTVPIYSKPNTREKYKYRHLTPTELMRIHTIFGSDEVTKKVFEQRIRELFSPMTLNAGVNIDELWNNIHSVNRRIIDNAFGRKSDTGLILYSSSKEPSIEDEEAMQLSAGLAIPIPTELNRQK